MWPPTITPCECAEPGFCPRHQCLKGYWQHRLCRRQPTVFEAYERGEGPGQPPYIPGQLPEEIPEDRIEGPGLMQRGWNLAKASARHVAGGLQSVQDDEFELRQSICRSCDFCDRQHMVCLHAGCGCFLNVKARWASESCPLGKWTSSSNPKPQDL